MIIPAPNREVEATILKLLRSEDISNAVKRLKDHLLQMLLLDKVLGMELSKFSRQLKMKPGIDDDYQVVVEMPNDLRLRGMKVEKKKEAERQRNKISLGSYVSANKTGSEQLVALDASSSSVRHGRF